MLEIYLLVKKTESYPHRNDHSGLRKGTDGHKTQTSSLCHRESLLSVSYPVSTSEPGLGVAGMVLSEVHSDMSCLYAFCHLTFST